MMHKMQKVVYITILLLIAYLIFFIFLLQVYFGGYFLRGHPLSMHTISYAINYWSRGQVQALFLRHEGYLGAIGAFLKGAEECG
jgi:pantothenate kinase